MPQKIYFDESGFTGNNLLNNNQTMFSYGSVATCDDEARDFVEYLIKKYGVQNGELKGSKLIKYNKGRKAISEIFDIFQGRIKVSLSDKKYALSGKFFEYIFEPCFSENNSLFYNINFHRFIANILHLEFVARGAGAEEIFSDFEELMRNSDNPELESLFSTTVHPENSPIMVQIREFALCQKGAIKKELASLPGDGVAKWILDLTNTALFSLLANWGLEHEQLTAICDDAKPLQHDQQLYNAMINREDKHFSHMGGEKHPITFNLSGPIQLVDSKTYHGVQLADAVAAASIYAVSGASDKHAEEWKGIIPDIAIYGSLLPDYDYVDLNRYEVQRNAVVMLELHSRATKNQSLLDGMPEYINIITQELIHNPLQINA
tara:strand:+ start:890 stop:2020 length:1131 start_codon:yes stop_codon:yes gene_type:complete